MKIAIVMPVVLQNEILLAMTLEAAAQPGARRTMRKPSDGEVSFCPCCQREEPLIEIAHMETEAGRPVHVGRCRSCGAEVPRFGGKLEQGAAPFALHRESVARPIVLPPRIPRPSLSNAKRSGADRSRGRSAEKFASSARSARSG